MEMKFWISNQNKRSLHIIQYYICYNIQYISVFVWPGSKAKIHKLLLEDR